MYFSFFIKLIKDKFEAEIAANNQQFLCWRKLPVNRDVLGEWAANSEPEMEQSDATVVQASAGQGQADELFDMAFDEDEDETEMLPSESNAPPQTSEPTSSTQPTASNQKAAKVTDSDTADIIDDISNWDFDADASPAEPQPEPQPKAPEEKPKKVDPVKEGMIEKTDEGFQPARTMTPDEFDRLFSEMNDEDK